MSDTRAAWRRIGPTCAISPNVRGVESMATPWPEAGASTTTRSYGRLWRFQRSGWASSQTLAMVISSFAPGAAATKYWNACEWPSNRPVAPPPSCRPSHSSSARCGSMVMANRPSLSSTSCSGRTPWRANARDIRSCSATSQTIVRRPRRAAARPIAAATVVFPTPPLPVTYRSARSRRSASILWIMPAMDPDLREGYETSRRMLRRHDPTYYFATRRLPPELRPATHALYGYVRTADQIVDGPRRPPTPAARRAALDAWEAELHAGAQSREPVVRALADAADRHRLPLGELGTYMRSMRIDCAPVRISSWEELVAYMDGSAGSVGRIMAPLLGVPAARHADLGRLGIAFQLANFVRDVPEDRRLDRVYLPAEDRERFGVSEEHLAAPVAGPELRALVAHEIARARALFAAARPAVAAAPPSVRPGVRFAIGLYRRMLDRIEASGFDVLGRSAGVRAWHVPGAAREALR